ncbi:MAG: hypothetical protein RL328_1625 [Acidobacteriota bacterium]
MTRAERLAERIEEGARGLEEFARSLTEEQWRSVIPPDGRTAGVIIHHVASVYPLEVQVAGQMASGKAVEGVTWAAIAEMNAGHAAENAGVSKTEAIALLRKNSGEAAEAVRKFTDAELDTAVTVSLNGDAPLTAQFFIEDHALRHSWHHRARIAAALG